MSQSMIRCPKCAAEVFGNTPGIATARWREHVIAVHTEAGRMSAATKTVAVSFYTCSCDWISKYCDEYHQMTVRIPVDVLKQYVEVSA